MATSTVLRERERAVEIRKISYFSTGPAVMASEGKGEFRTATLTHSDALIRYHDRSLRTKQVISSVDLKLRVGEGERDYYYPVGER